MTHYIMYFPFGRAHVALSIRNLTVILLVADDVKLDTSKTLNVSLPTVNLKKKVKIFHNVEDIQAQVQGKSKAMSIHDFDASNKQMKCLYACIFFPSQNNSNRLCLFARTRQILPIN